MGKDIKINMKPSRKYDGMKYRVKEMLHGLQTDADKRKSLMAVYDDIKTFQDCIDVMAENIWLCFVDEEYYRYHPSMVVLGFAWYYGLKEGIIPKDWPYDQVVYLIRRKVIFRLVEVQESFK
jgi:hypothetical protein